MSDPRERVETEATIAEQAAEIERLKATETCRTCGGRGEIPSFVREGWEPCPSCECVSCRLKRESQARQNEVKAERDTLRLEVQRLNDLSFEAQDRYAALEAERDQWRQLTVEARRERDAYSIRVNSLRADLEKARLEAQRLNDRLFAASNADAAIVAERDELRESEARWKEEACRLAQNADHHREKAEKYFAVIIDSGGRVDPDLSYEQDRREERFKILLDRYIDERIKIAVESDQRGAKKR